jgi:Putative zinc-finger
MPSQENENAMDGLLRRSLARDFAAAGDCPDAELLAAYFDQSLGADEAARYEIHFSACPRCREQLAAMARANAEQIEQSDLALEPALAGARPAQVIALDAARIPAQAKPTVASAARSETKEPMRKSPDPRWLDLRWLVPVAAMLVLGTFVFMRFASHQTSVGFNNQVAMTKSASQPQEQTTAEPEKKASDVGTQDKGELKNQPSPASSTQHPQSSARPAANGALTSESPRMQRSEGTFSRSATASRSVDAAGSRRPAKIEKVPVYVFRSPEWRTTEAPADRKPRKEKFPTEPAPAPPTPELNASMPSIVVATSSADAVKSPAPTPPPTAEQKSQAFGLKSQNLHDSAAANSLAKAKPARESYSETIIPTPDSDIFYRIAGGGFVEISEDGGVTWQRQLLNPSAEFTAGSAPEPRICWLVGGSGIVFLTEDGKNWQKLSSPTSDDLVAVIAKSASAATVTANDNRKWSTDDAGKNWHPVK